MAIGDGWQDGAWVDAGWVTGAWQVGAAAIVATVSRVSVGISIGIHSIVFFVGRVLMSGGWK